MGFSQKWGCAILLGLSVVFHLSALALGEDTRETNRWGDDDCRFGGRRGCGGRRGGFGRGGRGGFDGDGGRGGGFGDRGGRGGGFGDRGGVSEWAPVPAKEPGVVPVVAAEVEIDQPFIQDTSFVREGFTSSL
ncbi:hypothetical protein E3N88_05368 [Mikania micrantha]|uniref:Glycine-rich protein n=1 Tax=Mikania micrantha TaxID=192012 RepID=A0A5N6PLI6_9ASTR|nr:hypothetical protein E3N88_05368 [Mikania micrantha]